MAKSNEQVVQEFNEAVIFDPKGAGGVARNQRVQVGRPERRRW
jgi:hypothetical protein